MKLLRPCTWLLLVLPVCCLANADDWHFGGFGTAGIAHSDNDQADYRADNPFAPKGPGRSAAWDPGLDSKLGVQLEGQLSSNWSAVVQLVSERRTDASWTPQFEWANLKYQITPQWRASFGRVMAPVLMMSDWRKVGYAQIMVRPPAEVYTLNPITNLDGVDLEYRGTLGNLGIQAKAEYGTTHLRMNTPSRTQDYKALPILLGRVNLEYGGSTFSLSGMHVEFDGSADYYTLQSNMLQALISAGVPGAQQVQDNFIYRNAKAQNITLGYLYDRDQWQLRSEFFHNHSQGNVYADYSGWYVASGYRLARFTPYLSYARVWNTEQYHWPTLDSSGLSPQLAAMAQAVNAITRGVERGAYGQHTWTTGVRWDPVEKLAVKLQMEFIDKNANSSSLFVNTPSQFVTDRVRVKLFSATLDFIF